MNENPVPIYVSELLSTSDGLNLATAFMKIGDGKLRGMIVDLVELLANQIDSGPKRMQPTSSQKIAKR